jgi:hypothetical protein
MTSKRPRKHCPDCPEQCFCGSTEQLEDNHLGGRKHVPWLWSPFCHVDHGQYHANCRRAGVDFGKQKNKLMAKIQAFKAQLVGLWMVVEDMEKQVKGQEEK